MSITRTTAKAAARTAGSGALALAAVAAIVTAGGQQASAQVQPATLASTIAAQSASAHGYPNNLDGWIRQSLAIMHAKGIPGSYEGLHRNIIRESSGNTRAINLYDSNAAMGIPSEGLLQVIAPTFEAYHVAGTSGDIYDPVANIVAAANYAAHRYGSIDNVDSAY
ncbi:transglycosylase SLT domain-containing protein [Nocardia alni]|uniref:transglycosylase SLT domain-containing protein n=1 Tax=Nocardia alni TaxID=2815723 RepID=UPI001C22BBE4|nr:transglycosylase SLT domain-containing protein [Nocardia alni]